MVSWHLCSVLMPNRLIPAQSWLLTLLPQIQHLWMTNWMLGTRCECQCMLQWVHGSQAGIMLLVMDGNVAGHGSWGGWAAVFCSACLAEMEQGVADISISWFKIWIMNKKKKLKNPDSVPYCQSEFCSLLLVLRCLISSFIKLLLEVDVTCTGFVLGVRSDCRWCSLAGSVTSCSHISRRGKWYWDLL